MHQNGAAPVVLLFLAPFYSWAMFLSLAELTSQCDSATAYCPIDVSWRALGACSTLICLLWRTLLDHLPCSHSEKCFIVYRRIHLRFFRACGLAFGRTSFASPRTAMSDRLLAQ
jgi:hypothetical protein